MVAKSILQARILNVLLPVLAINTPIVTTLHSAVHGRVFPKRRLLCSCDCLIMTMEKHKLGISTISMGWHKSHTLEKRLLAAANSGYAGVEIFYTDLLAFAESHGLSTPEAASRVKELCQAADLAIICLGSFGQFEGSKVPLSERLAQARDWIGLAHSLGTNLIQVPSNDDGTAGGDMEVLVHELKELADLGKVASPPIAFAYEALAWGTHVADWEESWRVVKLVERENFGLCLDTYHVLSRLWADPRSQSGLRAGGVASVNASTKRFLDECPKEKIFYIQLSDAEKCHPPLLPGHPAYSATQDPTHSWCFWGRLFPGEEAEGGYLPMAELCKAWLVTKGFEGWVSMEVFHRDMKEEKAGPEHWASRGKTSWDRLVSQLY